MKFLIVCAIICASIMHSQGASLRNITISFMPQETIQLVDFNSIPIEEKALYVPELSEIAGVLSGALTETFAEVSVEVVECPDLTQQPYGLTSPGLSGDAKLIDLGSVSHLLPVVRRDKVYDLAALLQHLGRDPGFLAGAGAGPWPYVKSNGEGIVNLSVRDGVVDQGSMAILVSPVGAAKGNSTSKVERLPNSETRTAILGNYMLSAGETGQVLKVVVKNRVGSSNFPAAIKEALTNHYGDNVVALGGVFLLREGMVKLHVMPDFSSTPIESDEVFEEWLHYYDVPAPVAHVGVLVTGDLDLDLTLQHFHGWTPAPEGVGGHYRYDMVPAATVYEGYFSVLSSVIRIDQPAESQAIGHIN